MKKKIVIALIVLALPLVVRQSLYSNWFSDAVDTVKGGFESAGNAFKDAGEAVAGAAESAVNAVKDAATKAYDAAKTAANASKEGVTSIANQIASGAESAARTVGKGIQTGAQTVGGGIESAAKTVGSGVKDAALQVGKGFEVAAKFVADRFKNTKATRAIDYGIRKAGLESALAIATGVLKGAEGITQGTMIAAEQTAKGTLIASEEFLDKVGRNVTMAALKGPAEAAKGILEGAKQTTNAVLEAGKIIITKGVLGTFDINEISYHGELQELAQGSLGKVHVDMEILTQGIHPTITLDIKRGVEGVFDSFKSVITMAVDKLSDALFSSFKQAVSAAQNLVQPSHEAAQQLSAPPPQNLEKIHVAAQQAQQQIAAVQAQQATAAQTIEQKLQETTQKAAQALAEHAQKMFAFVNLTALPRQIYLVPLDANGNSVGIPQNVYPETTVEVTKPTSAAFGTKTVDAKFMQKIYADGKKVEEMAPQPGSIITVTVKAPRSGGIIPPNFTKFEEVLSYTDSAATPATFYILQRDACMESNQQFSFFGGIGQYVVTHIKPSIETRDVKFICKPYTGLYFLDGSYISVQPGQTIPLKVYVVDGSVISQAYIDPIP